MNAFPRTTRRATLGALCSLLQALTDLIGGQIQLMFVDVPSDAPRVKAGQLQAYAVTSLKRSAVLPDVPTMVEAGLARTT